MVGDIFNNNMKMNNNVDQMMRNKCLEVLSNEIDDSKNKAFLLEERIADLEQEIHEGVNCPDTICKCPNYAVEKARLKFSASCLCLLICILTPLAYVIGKRKQ